MIIRKMTAADLNDVAALEEDNFSEPWSYNSFEQALIKDYYSFFVAYDGDIHIGTVGFTRSLDEADISNVCVKSDYRNKGVAYELLLFGVEQMVNEGVNHFTLEVREGNKAAIGLYEKLGFVSEGIRPGFYREPVENAVIMWKHMT